MSLIAWYKLDSDIKNTITSKAGVLSGTGTSYTSGKLKNALTFAAGNTGMVNMDVVNSFTTNSNFSISCWLYVPSSYTWGTLSATNYIGVGTFAGSFGIGKNSANNNIYFGARTTGAGTLSVSTNITRDVWYHIVGVYDKTNNKISIYNNNSFIASTTAHSVVESFSATNFYIGGTNLISGNSDGYLTFSIDDVRIYDHALSQMEVSDIYKTQVYHYDASNFSEYTVNLWDNSKNVLGSLTPNGTTPPTVEKVTYKTPFGDEAWLVTIPASNNVGYAGCSVLGPSATMYYDGRKYSYFTYIKEITSGVSSALTIYPTGSRAQTGFTLDSSLNKGDWLYYRAENISDAFGGSGALYPAYYVSTTVASPRQFLIAVAQLEEKSYCTPFVNGTRSDILYDTENNANITLDSNCPKWTTEGYSFSETRHKLVLPASDNTIYQNGFSVSFQMYPRSSGISNTAGRIFDKTNGAITFVNGFGCFINNGTNLTFDINTTQFGATFSSFNAWYSVLITCTAAGSAAIYINNIKTTGTVGATSTITNTNALTIGNRATAIDRTFDGIIRDFRIYSSVLTDADADELHKSRAKLSNLHQLQTSGFLEIGKPYKASVIDYSTWVLGSSGSQTGFSQNGDGNQIVIKKNPVGVEDVVWASINNDVTNDADGGWDTPGFTIDNTKKYRFSVWIKKEGSFNGTSYLGNNSCCTINTTTAIVNPYFQSAALTVNDWFLWVGFVYPYGSTGNPTTEGKIYYQNGTVYASCTGFNWQNVNSSMHRSYLYYSTDPKSYQFFYRPRVDIVDGAEPSLSDLLNCRDNPVLYKIQTETGLQNTGIWQQGEFNEVGSITNMNIQNNKVLNSALLIES